MSLIKSISGFRGTIGGRPNDNLTPIDIVKFASAYGTWLIRKSAGKKKVIVGRDGRMSGLMVEALVEQSLLALGIDVVHLNHHVNEIPNIPYIQTMHGNVNHTLELDHNTVFVSKNHAARFGSDCYVHNGIDPMDYGTPVLHKDAVKNYFHFLGDAAWRVKNVKGAIQIAKMANPIPNMLSLVRCSLKPK